MWIVYIVKCSDDSLYTGITTDIDRRIKEHNTKLGAAYTKSRGPVKLAHTEKCATRSDALKRELQIKSWTRAFKLAFIKENAKLIYLKELIEAKIEIKKGKGVSAEELFKKRRF